MKTLSVLAFAGIVILFACGKKNLDKQLQYVEAKSRLTYKIVATVPSPADSARGIFSDSIILDSTGMAYSYVPFLGNFPGVYASINVEPYGFKLGYDNDNLPFPHFSFSSGFPTVPRYFEVNKAYESHTYPEDQVPIFLGRNSGMDGWNHFVNNEYPQDAEVLGSETYTKILFTKKTEYNTGYYDSTIVADGIITGYQVNRFSRTQPDKYVHRLDFTITFEGLAIED